MLSGCILLCSFSVSSLCYTHHCASLCWAQVVQSGQFVDNAGDSDMLLTKKFAWTTRSLSDPQGHTPDWVLVAIVVDVYSDIYDVNLTTVLTSFCLFALMCALVAQQLYYQIKQGSCVQYVSCLRVLLCECIAVDIVADNSI